MWTKAAPSEGWTATTCVGNAVSSNKSNQLAYENGFFD